MKQKSVSPSLLRDVVAVAGLYRDVFWMLGQQLRYGQDWQQRLQDDVMLMHRPEKARELAGQRHN